MSIPTKKLTNGLEIPILGFGTWLMGGAMEHDTENNDAGDIASLQEACETGITHFDTAEMYANGYAETLLGIALENVNRDTLFITSKVHPKNLAYDDVLHACKNSLQRLKMNYLDLYLIHAPSKTGVPLSETIRAFNTLLSEGIIKNWGVSNFDIPQMEEARSYSSIKMVTNQVHYNLIIREPEHNGVLTYSQKNDIILTAYRPLQQGGINNDATLMYKMSKKYQKTPAQISLNWLISQENVITIPRMKNKEHLDENLGALGWTMEKEDVELLRNNYPNQKTTRH